MVRVTFWLQLLLSVLILKQSDAAAYRSGELQEEIESLEEDMTNTTELKHNNGEQADNCCDCQSLLEADRSGEFNILQNLLKCCKDNCTDRDNTTPLMLAAAHGRVLLVRLLLEDGANAETANDLGWTALNAAARKGLQIVCRLLLDWGANMDTRNILGDTPLHGAAEAGYLSVVKLLVERGADVSVKNEDGSTPLQYAAMNGHLSVVKLLVESGADVTLKYRRGWTASEWARAQGNEDVAEWLDFVQESVSHDVDTEATNGTATDFQTTSVPSQNQTAILECGQQQGMQTDAGDPTEKLDLVSTEENKDCGPEEDACRSLLEAARSGDVDRAKGLAMCDSSDSSDNCTDVSSFRVTPQTDGPLVVHVDIASNNSRLRDQPAEVKASGNSPVTKAPAVMPNYYDQIAKEFEDQTVNKFSDKMPKEFQNQTAGEDVWRKVLEDHIRSDSDMWKRIMEGTSGRAMRRRVPKEKTKTDDVRRKLLEDQAASDNVRRKVLEDQTASDDGRSKVLENQIASELWRKILFDAKN